MKVAAVDADTDTNAQITYSLHGPGAQEFSLDPHTGRSENKGKMEWNGIKARWADALSEPMEDLD